MSIRTVLLSLLLLPGFVTAGETVPSGDIIDFRAIITSAKAKVFPAVVFLMPIAERFEGGKKEKQQVAGSGVIISEKGEVVTNWHVVDKAVTIRCLLLNGDVGTAEIVGTDKDTDIALLQLKIPGRNSFPLAKIGDSNKLEEGQFVMAMGAPWGMSRSVSLGIISCTSRFLNAHTGGYNLWLQTDASINPGNSGGPLVNTNGEVIGINTLGTFGGGDMAFSIPSNVVKRTVEALRKNGKVIRAWTGIRLQPLKDFQRNSFFPGTEGVLIASVDAGSPAAKAGVKVGDLLLKLGDQEVKGMNREDIPAINQMLADLGISKDVSLAVKRNDNALDLTLTPREKGKVEGDDFDCRDWNMTVKAINEFATPGLHFFKKKGVYIQGIKYPGNASKSGIGHGDILVKVDDKEVGSLDELQKVYKGIVEDKKREKKVNIMVLRRGLKHYLVLDYATTYEQD